MGVVDLEEMQLAPIRAPTNESDQHYLVIDDEGIEYGIVNIETMTWYTLDGN